MLERHGRNVWSQAPLTLRVYFGASFALALVWLAFYPTPVSFLWILAGLTLAYFMLRGVRWVWIFVVATSILFLSVRLLAGVEWINIGVGAAALVLLLAPATRRYFRRDVVGSPLRENTAVRAAASTVGLFIVSLICGKIGGGAVWVGRIAFLGMLLSAVAALLLSLVGVFALIKEREAPHGG